MTTSPAVRAPRMGTALTGTGELTRLAVRRDRIALPAAVYVIVALVAGTAYSFRKLYPTQAGRAALAATGESNPALRFLYGRLDGDSLGSLTTWRYGIWAAIFTALVAIFVVVRHTRTDEEAGRLELVGSAAVGRDAPLTAGLLPAVAASLLIATLLCLVLPLAKLPAAGSAAAGPRHRRLRAGVHRDHRGGGPADVHRPRRPRNRTRRARRRLRAARRGGLGRPGRPVLALLGLAAGLGPARPAVRRRSLVGARPAAGRLRGRGGAGLLARRAP